MTTNTQLTMETIVDFKFKGGAQRKALKEIYNPDLHGDVEDFFAYVTAWIETGRATITKPVQSRESEIADQIAKELLAVQTAKDIEEDRIARQQHDVTSHGIYKKVGFPAKSLLDAQEMLQQIQRIYHLPADNLGVEMKNNEIIVTIVECPVKIYASLERAFGFRRATETVGNVVDKTAKTVINATDMTVNNLAVPVAKTAISTTTKVAKSLFGFGAKIAGIAVSEVVKGTKQCVTEIKSDGYIQEARGEVIDGIHTVRKAINNSSLGRNTSGGGIIIE